MHSVCNGPTRFPPSPPPTQVCGVLVTKSKYTSAQGNPGQWHHRRLSPPPARHPYPQPWDTRHWRGGRDALEGKAPPRRPQKRFDRRLEEIAKAIGGSDCRLQMPLKQARAIRETVAGHTLGTLEVEGGDPCPLPMHPCQEVHVKENCGTGPACRINARCAQYR